MNFRHLVFFTILCFSLISSAFGAKYDKSLIRYDGVYKSTPDIQENKEENEEGYSDTQLCYYLRFYPDGTVITAGAKCNAKLLNVGELKKFKKWFRKGRENTGSFNFKIHEKTISFSAVFGDEKLDYSGELSDSIIRLTVFSNKNQYQKTNSYVFIKW